MVTVPTSEACNVSKIMHEKCWGCPISCSKCSTFSRYLHWQKCDTEWMDGPMDGASLTHSRLRADYTHSGKPDVPLTKDLKKQRWPTFNAAAHCAWPCSPSLVFAAQLCNNRIMGEKSGSPLSEVSPQQWEAGHVQRKKSPHEGHVNKPRMTGSAAGPSAPERITQTRSTACSPRWGAPTTRSWGGSNTSSHVVTKTLIPNSCPGASSLHRPLELQASARA